MRRWKIPVIPPRYFAFVQELNEREFIIELTDPAKIAHALRVLSGDERSLVHVNGRIKLERAPYNPGWSFHLDPATIGFFEMSIEVCDADMNHIEEHLDAVGGSLLPRFFWCPWNSRIVREVVPSP